MEETKKTTMKLFPYNEPSMLDTTCNSIQLSNVDCEERDTSKTNVATPDEPMLHLNEIKKNPDKIRKFVHYFHMDVDCYAHNVFRRLETQIIDNIHIEHNDMEHKHLCYNQMK